MHIAEDFLIKWLTTNKEAPHFYLNHAPFGLFYFRKGNASSAQVDKKLQHFLKLSIEENSFNPYQYLDVPSQEQVKEIDELTATSIYNFTLLWEINLNRYQTICNAYFLPSEDIVLVGLGEMERLYTNPGEKYFNFITENSPEGIMVFEKNHLAYASPELLNFVGESLESMLGRHSDWFFDGAHPEDRPRLKKVFEEVFTKKIKKKRYRFRVKNISGEYVWREDYSGFVFNDEGELVRSVVVTRDINHQIELEEKLVKKEEVYRKLFDNVQIGLVISDKDTNILEANDLACSIFGLPKKILTQTKINDANWTTFDEHLNPIKAENLPAAKTAKTGRTVAPIKIGFENQDDSKTINWIELSSSPLFNENSEIDKIVCTFLDVTERHKAETQLQLEKKRLENVINGVKLGTWEWDMKKDSFDFNVHWAEMIGYKLEDVMPGSFKVWSNLVHPADLEEAKTAINAHINGETENYEAEFRMQHKKGHWVWILSKGKIIKRDNEDKPYIFSGIHYNINERKKQEENLRLFESIIKNTKDAVLITEAEPYDLPGPRIEFVNQAFCNMTGYSEEELIGKTPRILQGPKSDRKVLDKLRQSLKNWESFEGEIINYKKNREEYWVSMSITPLADERGWFTNWIVVARDITESKKAKELLAASEEKYRDLVENTNEIIYTITSEGIFAYTSPSWIRLLGHTKEETEGHSFTEFVHPEDIPKCTTFLQKVLDTGERQSGVEYRVKHKDGHWVWHASSANPIKDNSGKVIGFNGLASDITERKSMQDKLIKAKENTEKSEQRLKIATKSAELGIWDWNLKTKEIIWDDKSYELYGFKKDRPNPNFELWSKSVHPDDLKLAIASVENVLQGNQAYNTTFRIIHPNGKILYLNAYGMVIKDSEGNPARMIGVHRDVTEAKLKEIELFKAKNKAEAASVAKSDFLANMSHEIRTPLNSVIGFSELLMQTQLDISQTDYMQSINYSANALLDLINDILDFSKIEAGKLELNPERTDLHQLLYQIVEMVKFKLSKKNIELLLYIASDIPQYVFVDAVRLRQILVNLMGNAVKFTDSGEVELSVVQHGKTLKNGENLLKFGVRDTGIGIPASKQKFIFNAFSQEDNSTTRKYGGTGLGLSISKKILDLMGSDLQLESEKGKGSHFYFEVPLQIDEHEKTAIEKIEGIDHILLVDDNIRSQESISQTLQTLQIKIDTASNGLEALSKIQANWQHYDVVLLDNKMPFMDANEIVEKINLQLNLNNNQLPIIIMDTVLNEEEFKLLNQNYPIKGLLRKPLNKTEFLELFKIPEKKLIHATTAKNKIEDEIEHTSYESQSILIVDDNAINRKLASNMLRKLYSNLKLFEAESGEVALELVEQQDFTVILMDVQMPILSGYETTKAIRKIKRKNKPIIVALTAGTVKGEKERCIAAGMDDYMSKPVTMAKMEEVIAKWTKFAKSKMETAPPMSAVQTKLGFNYEALLVQLNNDAEVAEEILDLVRNGELEELVLKLTEIDDYLENIEDIKELAHKIKGIALNLYFEKLEEKAGKLENQYPNYQSKETKELVVAINEAHREVEKIVLGMEYKKSNLKV